MKKNIKKIIGLLLVFVLCLSMSPISVLATAAGPDESVTEQTTDAPQDNGSTQPAEPTEDPAETSGTPADEAEQEKETPEPVPPTQEVTPELGKSVDSPLVTVVYNYYEAAGNRDVTDFADYELASSHAYHVIAMADDAGITIAANRYPGKVPVSTDAFRFRVLLSDGQDITNLASYNAASGLVTLPSGYLGHKVTVEWYCPTSEIVQLPITVSVCEYIGGEYITTNHPLSLASNTNSVSIPLSATNAIVVSQNNIDMGSSSFSAKNGVLTVSAAVLGGDLSVSAYAPVKPVARAMSGITAASSTKTTVKHTRSANQIYYGYYTSIYKADGNYAFCMNTDMNGVDSGTYEISRWLTPGSSTKTDTLIKVAYYLWGPGYDSVKKSLFTDPDSDYAYGLSHAVAAYVWMEDDDAFKGLGDSTIAHLKEVLTTVKAQPMPPSGFSAFIYNVGNTQSQSLLSWVYEPIGNLEIQKVSSNPDMTKDNNCYSLEGAEFEVYDGDDTYVGTIVTDKNGYGRLDDIPAGSGYYLVEVSPPKGYAERTGKISFTIKSDETKTLEIKNNPQGDPAAVVLQKVDAFTGKPVPEGDASLAGAEFVVEYYKGIYTEKELESLAPARTWVLMTDDEGFALLNNAYKIGGDDFYYDSTGKFITIPLGTVRIYERKAPDSYKINPTVYVAYVTSEGKMETVHTYNEPTVPEAVKKGGVRIRKYDVELQRPGEAQGSGTIAGATFNIRNLSANPVEVSGVLYQPGEIVYTGKTDSGGIFITPSANFLPVGRYRIEEPADGAPGGYLNKGKISQEFTIVTEGVIVDLTTMEWSISNIVKRGALYIEKFDNEIDRNESQGKATIDETVIHVINRNANPVIVDDVEYAPNAVVCTLVIKDGHAETPARYLPVGTYECVEISPPREGYLATGVLSRTFTLTQDGEVARLETSETAIKNNPIRGDVSGVKISDTDGKRMANIPFEIRSLTTGEAHVLVTDRNGEFSTSSAWNPHSRNTNRGETPEDGIWFGELWTLDDSMGALLYDDYILTEQPCEENKDRELLTFTFSVYRHGYTINLGTLTNDYTVVPEIITTARDSETTTNDAFISEETKIYDTIYYSGLKMNTRYVMRGVLVDAESGEPIVVGGEQVTSTHTFRALSESGNVTVEFNFDSTGFTGKSVVVYEYLEDTEGNELAKHEELESEEQRITFFGPSIETTLTDTEGGKEFDVLDEITLVDEVEFTGLIVGQTYTLRGVLMDKETNTPLEVDGRQVTTEKQFVAETEHGTISLEFKFSSIGLQGKTIVAFEYLEYKNREIAVHTEIESEAQSGSVKTPTLATEAKSEAGEKHIPTQENAKITDTITYSGLVPGRKYVVKGILMNKASGKELQVSGKTVTGESAFVPESGSGTVEVVFELDSRTLDGVTVVVFEELYLAGSDTPVAVHKDISDEKQAVFISAEPISIKTYAKAEDGSKTIPLSKTAKVVDQVSYEGLIIGETYVVSGVLMLKESGKPVLVEGQQVTASTSFVARETTGTVDVIFEFDATSLKGQSLVVFEKLTYNDTVVAAHEDLSDTDQTVTVGTPSTTGGGAKTGRDGLPVWLLIVALAAAGGAVGLFIWKKRKSSAPPEETK